MDWEFAVGRCKLLHLNWINDKVLLFSWALYPNHNVKEYKKNVCVYIYIYIYIYIYN